MNKGKKSPRQELRRPPGSEISPEIDSWVSGGPKAAPAHDSVITQAPSLSDAQASKISSTPAPNDSGTELLESSDAQVPDKPVPHESKPKPSPTNKKGIVERSGGRLTRRVVFYLDPDQAEALRRRAFDEGRDMSAIVAQLVDHWLKSGS